MPAASASDPGIRSATSLAASADGYIVVLKDNADSGAVADQHRGRYGAQLKHVYRHALRGYAATIPNARVDEVRRDQRVDYVERDQTAHAVAQTLPWGIDKVDADTSSTLAGNGSGAVSNVNAYVIDSGIDKNHTDLAVGNRHVNFAGGPNTDCNGHGTHVAGSVAARDNTSDVVGVAPGAPLTGVKVLGCDGSGSYSGVIAGVDWVTKYAAKPAVANMSLGGPKSDALDAAVRNSAASGIFYALAAGNAGADACNSSPARAGAGTDNGIGQALTTGSPPWPPPTPRMPRRPGATTGRVSTSGRRARASSRRGRAAAPRRCRAHRWPRRIRRQADRSGFLTR